MYIYILFVQFWFRYIRLLKKGRWQRKYKILKFDMKWMSNAIAIYTDNFTICICESMQMRWVLISGTEICECSPILLAKSEDY